MGIPVAGILLEGCVLSFLISADEYGYSLTQKAKDALGVSESTLYPVMRRLQTDNCLSTYDVPHNGRNRRYYRITERGRAKYRECAEDWRIFKENIDGILHKNLQEGTYRNDENTIS
ncbi:MAG: PadR family transcriptional regulator [Defluviitaleaceae bacterium]|nr:PadR family transcriptional regulator [Defluviitaleaceae bacterium]MCL2275507.1 PadR family transcriptional regulator [Defluviitaleaceae bacterium]